MYLELGHFIIHTYHPSSQRLFQSNQNKQPRLWRWCLLLQTYYDFEVQYIPGATNYVVDALSRAINVTDFTNNVIDWPAEQRKDKNLCIYINNTNDRFKHYNVSNNILYRILPKARNVEQNHVNKVVPAHLISQISELHHNSKFAGHGGIYKTKQSILHANLWWERMDHDIQQHVEKCELCQRVKGKKNTTVSSWYYSSSVVQ